MSEFDLAPGTRGIVLSSGSVALVDEQDYIELVNFGSWSQVKKDGHAVCYKGTRETQKGYLMHLVIATRAGLDISNDIDHKDRNKINNCRSNLRPATRSQNNMNSPEPRNNTSGCKGVNRHQGRWRAYISKDGKQIHLGCYDTFEQAASARLIAERRFYGEFAR